MFWVILGIILLCLPSIVNHINAQKEAEQDILNSAYELFEDEELRALSKEEQERAWDRAWDTFENKTPELTAAYHKVKELIKKGTFTDDNAEHSIWQPEKVNGNSNCENYDDYYDENIDIETGEILEAYRNEADGLDYEAYNERIELWNKYIEIAKIRGYISPQADGYYQLAHTYDDMNNFEKAIENYSKAIDLNPEDSLCYNFRVDIYEKLGEYDKAIEDYTKLLELTEYNAEHYEKRADCYLKLQNYENAVEDYTFAIEASELAIRKMKKLSNADIAIKTFGTCLNIADYVEFAESYIRRYSYKRGIVYYKMQRYNEAIRDFKLIKNEDKEYSEAKKYLNKALIAKGNNYLENKGN